MSLISVNKLFFTYFSKQIRRFDNIDKITVKDLIVGLCLFLSNFPSPASLYRRLGIRFLRRVMVAILNATSKHLSTSSYMSQVPLLIPLKIVERLKEQTGSKSSIGHV